MQQAVDNFPIMPCHLVNKIKFLSVQLTLASKFTVHIPCHVRYGTQLWAWVSCDAAQPENFATYESCRYQLHGKDAGSIGLYHSRVRPNCTLRIYRLLIFH